MTRRGLQHFLPRRGRPSLARAVGTLDESLTLRVDPATVCMSVDGKLPLVRRVRRDLRRSPRALPAGVARQIVLLAQNRHPFVLPEDLYPEREGIEASGKYRRLASLVEHLDEPHESLWWHEGLAKLAERGEVKLKSGRATSEDELERYLISYLRPLILSLRDHGYRDDLAGPPGLATIAADGRIDKASKATHRFALARILGLTGVPVRIQSVHEDWWERVTSGRSTRARLEQVRDALRGVEDAHAR